MWWHPRKEQAIYSDEPLRLYLDDLASSQAMPAAGTACALTGALGAALTSMVARLTFDKAGDVAVGAEMRELLRESEQLRARFQALLQEDSAVYEKLIACYRLPRATAGEQQARAQAIHVQLIEATKVPLQIVENTAELLKLCQRLAQIGYLRVLSDLSAGATLAASASTAAAGLVQANLQGLRDAELILVLEGRLAAAAQVIAERHAQTLAFIEARG